jgi:hypothetical protein
MASSRLTGYTCFTVALASAALSITPANAVSVIDNLSATKVQDSPIADFVSPFSSFKTGPSLYIAIKNLTVSLSSFSAFDFDNLSINLYAADASGMPVGSILSSVTNLSGSIDQGVTCTGNFGALWCKDFTYDLSSFAPLSANSNYALALSRPGGLLFWDFAASPASYTTALGFVPLLSGNPDSPENKDPRYHIYQLGVDVNPIPTPLPLFGVAAAYGYSRKLRARIQRRNMPLTHAID